MNTVLAHWNSMDAALAACNILPCCGSHLWAEKLSAMRPFADEHTLFATSDSVWLGLPEAAWQEAFDSHPRIGQHHAQKQAATESLRWSEQEQKAALSPDATATRDLEDANQRYEEHFGRIFIVCAAGRSAQEILDLLEARMSNNPATELREAVEQQRQITQLRLRRWLGGN